MSRICVSIPTYNEIENLRELLERLISFFTSRAKDAWILVVDDSSPDGTGQLAEEFASKHSNVRVIHRPEKRGIGSAYKDAFKEALADTETDIVLEMDADLSHDPVDIEGLVKGLEEFDVSVGSRYVPGGRIVGWSRWRRLVSWGGNTLARLSLRLGVKDATSGFRAYRRRVLESIDCSHVRTEAYAFQVEMLFRSKKSGFKVGEVPIVFRERARGRSKLSRSDVWDFLKTVLSIRFRG